VRKQSCLVVSILLAAALILPPTGPITLPLNTQSFIGITSRWIGLYTTEGTAVFTEVHPTFVVGESKIRTQAVQWSVWKTENYIVLGDKFTDNILIFAYSPECLLPTASFTVPGFEWLGIAGDDRFYVKGTNGIMLVNAEGKIIGWPQNASPSPPLIPKVQYLNSETNRMICHSMPTATIIGKGVCKRVRIKTDTGEMTSHPVCLKSLKLALHLSGHLKAYQLGESTAVIVSKDSISMWKINQDKLNLIKWHQIAKDEIAIGPLLAKSEGPVIDFVSGRVVLPYISSETLNQWQSNNACDIYNTLLSLRIGICRER